MMLSGREETQKRMLANKQLSSKNPKLASMTTIANRSPQNRGGIAATSPPLGKKATMEGSQKVIASPRPALSPKNNSRDMPRKEVAVSLPQKRSSGPIRLANGDEYEGDTIGDAFNGKGMYVFSAQHLKYEGEFEGGKQHGYGVLVNTKTN